MSINRRNLIKLDALIGAIGVSGTRDLPQKVTKSAGKPLRTLTISTERKIGVLAIRAAETWAGQANA